MRGLRTVFPRAHVCDLEPFDPYLLKPGPGEILLKTRKSLVSIGTELNIFTGRHSNLPIPGRWPSFPFQPGYSMTGTVLETGESVTHLKAGDLVFASAPHASHSLVPAASAIPVPPNVSAEQAAFCELGTIALNGIRLGNIVLGDATVVVGQGIVGLLTLRLAYTAGARPLIAVDLSPGRLSLSANWGGATDTADPRTTDLAGLLRTLTADRLADVIIEATGTPAALVNGLPWVRNGGRVVLLGSPHGKIEMDFYDQVHRRNLRLIGGHISGSTHPYTDQDPWSKERDLRLFLDLLAGGDLGVNELISHRATPDTLPQLYELAAEQPSVVLGAIIDWEDS